MGSNKDALGWRALISVVLAIIGVRIIINSRRSKFPSPRETSDVEEPTDIPAHTPRKVWRGRRFGPLILFATLTVLAGIGGWRAFTSSNSGTPQRPSFNDGGILILVSDPRERDITIDFTVNESGYFELTAIPESQEFNDEMFLVVSSGSASVLPQPPLPATGGELADSEFTDKVHIDTVAQDDKGDFAVGGDGKGGFDNTEMRYVLYGYEGSSNVSVAVGDQYDGNLDSNQNFLLCGRLRNLISRSSGGMVLGALPLIGAPGTMEIESSGNVVPSSPVGSVTIAGDLLRLNQNEAHVQFGNF
jgi:hypothetical protein